MKKILTLLLAALLVFSLAACSEKENVNRIKVTDEQRKALNEKIEEIPEKEGFVFAGWYSDKLLTDYIIPGFPTDTQYVKGTAYPKWITVPDSVEYEVRESPTTVTDSGRENQQMDAVYVNRDYNFTDLKRAGYRYLEVVISLEISEKSDGYQHVFIYKDTNCLDSNTSFMDLWDKYIEGQKTDVDPSMLHWQRFDYGGDGVTTEWGRVTVTALLNLEDLKEALYIRYGATGKESDTWENRNVTVTVTPVK